MKAAICASPNTGPRCSGRAPARAALFSCSLQHEALPVTAGRRSALLSFFYDEPARRVREENLKNVANAGEQTLG
jgi:hypothetical protein